MRGISGKPIALLAAVLMMAPPITCAATLDQVSEAVQIGGIGVDTNGWYQQDITAGADDVLSQIDLYVYQYTSGNSFTLSLYNGGSWHWGAAAATFVLSPAATGWMSIDVSSANFSLTSNQKFTIGLSSSASVYQPFIFGGNNFNPYGAGQLYGNGGEVAAPNGTGWDLLFRSYVGSSSPTVPLPAAVWLLLSGLAGIGLITQRKAR